MSAPKLTVTDVRFFERDVRLRMPFRFGVVTLTEAPQTFVRARVRLADGREGWGMAAELLAPKWFDKSPGLSNEDNFDQLRRALGITAAIYRGHDRGATAFGLHAAFADRQRLACREAGLPPLVASFGAALVDRAILDALLRLEHLSVFEGTRRNVFGLDATTTPDLEDFDIDGFLAGLEPAATIKVRHTVGLVDPIVRADQTRESRLEDGLPETLEEVVESYGVDRFKLKVGGDLEADIERLSRIAAVIDQLPHYEATLDGNEQYDDVDAVVALWERIAATPALARLKDSILFIEQPIARTHALSSDIYPLARLKPVEIDESDGEIDAFLKARALGYTGVSSKSCKGFYRSLLNRARCAWWNAGGGAGRDDAPLEGPAGTGPYFMSAEDLTTQAGVAVQQDLALATLIGCTHVERNGHHYVNGMAAAPADEQRLFLAAHADLYEESFDAVRLRIEDGTLEIGSLDTPGLGVAPEPDFSAMRAMSYPEA